MNDPKRIVAAGYDAMATRFDEWQTHVVGPPRMQYVEKLLGLLPSRPDVLELGCGAGVEFEPCPGRTRTPDGGRHLRGAARPRAAADSDGDVHSRRPR
jgi:hypothetical protein